MEFISDLGLFISKAVVIVGALMAVVVVLTSVGGRGDEAKGKLTVRKLNDDLKQNREILQGAILDKLAMKQLLKNRKKTEKEKEKQQKKAVKQQSSDGDIAGVIGDNPAGRLFVINFHGDIKASAVSSLREEVSAILAVAREQDEVVVCVESPGGVVHGYGLAASQLQRIREKGIKLVVCVDKVAASGGYMVACLGDRLIAAPFAILGSIGVIGQLPNVNRLLKKCDIDIEMHTAGEYKRTLTMLGENTQKGREKFIEELQDIHLLFKEFIRDNRPVLDIDEVATGEVWYGRRALEKKLVDEIQTSDEYLHGRMDANVEVYSVRWVHKKTLLDKVGLTAARTADQVVQGWWSRLIDRRNSHF